MVFKFPGVAKLTIGNVVPKEVMLNQPSTVQVVEVFSVGAKLA